MLGNSTLQSHISNSYSVDIKPRVFAEWNNNILSKPYMCGTDTFPSTFNNISSINAIGSTPDATSVSRGEATTVVDSISECFLLLSDSDESSVKVSARTIVNGVVTLEVKTGTKAQLGSGKDIYVETSDSDINGKFTTQSGTNKAKIVYDTGNSSLNKNRKVIRNSKVTLSESSYYVDVSSMNGAIKFFMGIKSDYEYQSSQPGGGDFVDEFDVLFTAIGFKGSSRVWSQVVTKRVTVNSRQWDYVDIMFSNPDEDFDDIDTVRLEINLSTDIGKKAGLLVNQPSAFGISPYEVYISDIMPVSNIFKSSNSGELVLDNSGITVDLDSTSTFPQQPTTVHMANRFVITNDFDKVQRSVAPYAGNPNNYYVSGSSLASKRFWAVYDKKLKTNKIVIKVNAIITKPSIFQVYLLVDDTWTSGIISSESFDDNGILTLYYDGSDWSATEWAYNSYPKISTSSGTIDKFIEINGIALTVGALQYSTNSESIRDSSYDLGYLDLIEISPRFELDLTDYLVEFSIDKELSSDESPLPLGSMSSNTASVLLNKYPIVIDQADTLSSQTNDIIPISNYAAHYVSGEEVKNSPLMGMLVKGVKLKGFFDIDQTVSGVGATNGKTSIPAFIMYAESWAENSDGVTIECYDLIKKLQSIKCPSLYFNRKSINEIAYSILDAAGVSDYYINDIMSLRVISLKSNELESIPHFWTNRDNSVAETLNDLFKPYQISMYADEFNGLKFVSLYELATRRKDISNQDIAYIQDINDSNSVSNIGSISFNQMEKPSEISISYKKPYQWNNPPELRKSVRKELLELGQTALASTTKIVWEPEQDSLILPYFELSSPGIISKKQQYIKYNVSKESSLQNNIDYSGYLLIDKEIIKYDGLEYVFTPASIVNKKIVPNEDNSFIAIVKSPEDIVSLRSDALRRFKSADTIVYGPTGYIRNVERGHFGTVPDRHIVLGQKDEKNWTVKEFAAGYKNVSDVSESSGIFNVNPGRINVTSKKSSGGYIIYPNENNKVLKKRKLYARCSLGNIPKNKDGYIGVAVGVEISSGAVQNGVFVMLGIDSKKKDREVAIFIQEVVNGSVKNIVKKGKLTIDETLFDEGENIDIYAKFNSDMTKLRVYIGSTSVFQKIKKTKKKGEKIEEVVDFAEEISKVNKSGLFGFVVMEHGVGMLDNLAFVENGDPSLLNSLDFYDLEDDYSGDKNTGSGFYIGSNTLLNQIVYNRNVEMSMSNNLNKNNFIWTGAPVARGLKIIEAEYQDFPSTGGAEAEFLGYTYPSDSVKTTNYLIDEDENG